jgi:cell division septation protein DedD
MDTKDFDVVRIARSDGVDTGPGYWPVVAPTSTAANASKKGGKETTAADKAPRTKPQMTRLAEDDPRFVEWRIKLGILLKQELSPTPDGKISHPEHCRE